MSGEVYSAAEPRSLKITKSRWDVTITIETAEGQIRTLIASADSGLTNHDGIFLGTDEEYREAQKGFW